MAKNSVQQDLDAAVSDHLAAVDRIRYYWRGNAWWVREERVKFGRRLKEIAEAEGVKDIQVADRGKISISFPLAHGVGVEFDSEHHVVAVAADGAPGGVRREVVGLPLSKARLAARILGRQAEAVATAPGRGEDA